MERRRLLAGAAGLAATALAGCAGALGSSEPPEHDVGMAASAFRPARIEATVGETVTWYNGNSRAHTVTAYGANIPTDADYFASGGFDSERAARDGYRNGLKGALATGDTFEHTFEVPGRYDYFCVPHEAGGMVGTVVVRG